MYTANSKDHKWSLINGILAQAYPLLLKKSSPFQSHFESTSILFENLKPTHVAVVTLWDFKQASF